MSLERNSHSRRTRLALLFALAIGLAPAPALAAGGGGNGGSNGGGNGGGSNGSGQDMTTCPKGQVWNTHKHRCVKAESGVLPDEELSDYAYALAKADRYDEALGVLDLLHDTKTPKALNYRGYATRKLGRTEEGIGYYLQSVALDPHYTQVREYLGEAYVIEGRLDLAGEQLKTIGTLCGTDCEEYRDLAEAIADRKS